MKNCIFLERMLKLEKIDFKIAAFDKYDDTDGIIIFKPHGSISFCSKDKRISSQPYNIEKDPIDSTLAEIKVMENNLEIVEDMSNINPIIPPASDGDRIQKGWSHDIKNAIKESLKTITKIDNCIIYGVSYDNVDRREIDDLITNIPWDIEIKNINPSPSSTFDMVLGSIFKNYTHIIHITRIFIWRCNMSQPKRYNRSNTTTTVSVFYEQFQLKKYNFNPAYQRESGIWKKKDKEFLLDTIFKNFPMFCVSVFLIPFSREILRTLLRLMIVPSSSCLNIL